MPYKAKLISLDGFKVIREIIFEDYPLDKICNDDENKMGRALLMKNKGLWFMDKWSFNYQWVTQKMFPDHMILDCQASHQGYAKGHPDFIAIKKDFTDEKEILYIEFKSEDDRISSDQMKWFCNNSDQERYIIQLESQNGKFNI